MSGGDRKKRVSQGTGWEEAGGEFYQESYPGAELDLEALPRDPHYFATLLPSKQTRAATTRRPRADNKATFKRRTSTRSRNCNTMGQNTMPNDIHVAMMPDLSENLANEETTWEEMMLIKTMPIGMAQKREIKAKLMNNELRKNYLQRTWSMQNNSADTFRLQGLKQFKWKRRKLWEYLKIRRKELYKRIELWRKSFLKIEGNYGPGVVCFFSFIKWLMFLNLAITVLIVCFVILPTLLLNEVETDPCYVNNETVTDECCVRIYRNSWSNFTLNPYLIVQGNGWLESTILFYGVYPSSLLEDTIINYNLPLAYIFTTLGYFILSLFTIIKRARHGFRERLIENEGQYYKYCTMIFSGWDYCIFNENSAKIKHAAVYNEIKDCLNSERRKDEMKNRTRDEKFRLLCVRCFVNCVILILFFAAGSLIFFCFQYSIAELEKDIDDDLYRLLLEFIPYLFIVGLHLIVPNILNYFVSVENYSPIFSLRLTYVRTIILRLLTLGVLFGSFYSLVKCPAGSQSACSRVSCRRPICWETLIGQQIYKLLITDIVLNIAITFLINFPRMLIAKHIKCRAAQIFGAQEFDLPKHVLDIVYIQTLVWFGSFYAPLLPAIATILFFLVFYIKKFVCLVNCSPSMILYRASRSDSMFMSVLLVHFFAAVIPWIYTTSELEPSLACGPFRTRPYSWTVMEDLYRGFPWWVSFSFEKIASTSFALPAFFILLLTLYYFHTISNANKQMVCVLKKQLILEGHDKQFLLNRLSAFIKQHQERHKAARSVDPPSTSN